MEESVISHDAHFPKKAVAPWKNTEKDFYYNYNGNYHSEHLLFQSKPKLRLYEAKNNFDTNPDHKNDFSTDKDRIFLPKINQFKGRMINSPKLRSNNVTTKEFLSKDKIVNSVSLSPQKKRFSDGRDAGKFSVMNNPINRKGAATPMAMNDKSSSNKDLFVIKPTALAKHFETNRNVLTCDNNSSQKKVLNNILLDIPKLNLKVKVKQVKDSHPPKLVKNFWSKEETNLTYKEKMEDFVKIVEKSEDQFLCCLFDGHGGDYVAKFAKDRFPEIFFAYLSQFENNVHKTFQESLSKLDHELNYNRAQSTGSTATIIYLTRESPNKKVLYSANLGDSRSILLSKDKVLRLSYDHKCSDKEEINRMRSAGGFIINGRLLGTLNLSRSLGDLSLKKSGLSNIPFIHREELSENDHYVVIASDGVWDVIRDEDALNISKDCSDSKELCETLVKESMKLGSRDNISCITVNL